MPFLPHDQRPVLITLDWAHGMGKGSWVSQDPSGLGGRCEADTGHPHILTEGPLASRACLTCLFLLEPIFQQPPKLCCLGELSSRTEMFYISTVQNGSHELQEATE